MTQVRDNGTEKGSRTLTPEGQQFLRLPRLPFRHLGSFNILEIVFNVKFYLNLKI